MLKKITLKRGLIICLSLMISIAMMSPVAFAAGIVKSSNDTKESAATIQPNTNKVASLDSADDVNFYKVNITTSGYFAVSLSTTAGTADVKEGWQMEIQDGNNNSIYSSGSITGNTKTPQLDFAPGTYYIIIKAYSSYSSYYEPILVDYSLRVDSIEDSGWEQEYNDTKASASNISEKSTYYGNLYNADDEDYYKVRVTKKGYFTINLGTAGGSAEVMEGWKMEIQDSDNNSIYSSGSITGNTKTPQLDFAPGIYYIIIKAYSSYSSYYDPIFVDYSLRVDSIADSSWEQEYNNTTTSATSLKINQRLNGNLYNIGDEDYYKVVINNAGTFTLKFSTIGGSNEIGDYGWDVKIRDSSNNIIFSKYNVRGAFTQKSITCKKGTYYVVVSSYLSVFSSPIFVQYSINVGSPVTSASSLTAVKITSVKTVSYAKKKVKLTWSKSSKTAVTRYQIYKSTKKSSGFKKIATVKTGSYKVTKGLKSGKRYYFKIRGYKVIKGKVYYTKWSVVKSIQIK